MYMYSKVLVIIAYTRKSFVKLKLERKQNSLNSSLILTIHLKHENQELINNTELINKYELEALIKPKI